LVVIVFRARLKPGVDMQSLEKVGSRMYELASAMPGFVSYKDFAAQDGESVSVIEFDSLESVAAWREHPEHKLAQRRGRDEFFAEFRIQVCSQVRDTAFQADAASEKELSIPQ
jgi:heme-degrading monooxygenase HmoA